MPDWLMLVLGLINLAIGILDDNKFALVVGILLSILFVVTSIRG